MAKFKFLPTTDVSGYFTAKIKGAVTDNDLGKPVKLSIDTTDTYELCSDGNAIDAFIVALAPATADGLHLVTLTNKGRFRCQASGALVVGGLVEAGAVAAAGTAETNGLPLVSAKAAVAPDLAGTPSDAQVIASVNALLAEMLLGGGVTNWRVISGNTTDGDIATGDLTVIIERL